MGAGFSEAFDLFQSKSDLPISKIKETARNEINLTENLINLFAIRYQSNITFSEIRNVIRNSPLFYEYCDSLMQENALPEFNDDDTLDPISRDLMALDAAETRELAIITESMCQDETDVNHAYMKYLPIPKSEIKTRALNYLHSKWTIHPALIEGWMKQ